MAATDPDMQDHLERYSQSDGITEPRSARAGHEHGRCVTCSARKGDEHRPHCPALAPPSLRVPMTGLAAVAWNAHLDADRLEVHESRAVNDEIQRLRAESDAIGARRAKRREGVLRAVVKSGWMAGPTSEPWVTVETVNAGPIHIEQDEDGTLVAVLSASRQDVERIDDRA